MNTVSLSGNLVSDPNLKHVGDRPICELRIAVDNGRHPTTYIDIHTFDGQAYSCADYLRRGRGVGVEARRAFILWLGGDANRRHRYAVVGRVEFLDDRRRPEHAPAADGLEPPPETPEVAEPQLALAA
jgi:single-stranded DNA-binding protein